MGIIENLKNASISPPPVDNLTANLTNENTVNFIQETLNSTTEGWAVYIFLALLYFFGLYIFQKDDFGNSQDLIKVWVLLSCMHLGISITLFLTGWMIGYQKFLWNVLFYMIGLIASYLIKSKS